MYQIAYIGRWETLPETAAAICDHDTSKLEALLQGGLDLDVPIQLSEYIKLMPLEIPKNRNLQWHQLDVFAELDGNI